MSKKNLPPIHRKASVSFDIENNESLITDPLPPIFDKLENKTEKEIVVDVAIQTDSHWLDELKKDLLFSLQTELNNQEKNSAIAKSKQSTVRTKHSKVSSVRSKVKSDQTIQENFDVCSERSIESSISTIPPYPEMKMDDEFGVALFHSSDEDDDNFDPGAILQMVDSQYDLDIQAENQEKNITPTKSIISDAGLPTILKVSKELGATDLSPPLSAEAFLINSLSPKDGEVCEFCKKLLVAMPSVKDQVSSSVNQAELFCCQEYRKLVDFALAQQCEPEYTGINSDGTTQSTAKLIDISPHKSAKSADEVADSKAKSEKRIRERLFARQQAALVAAEAAKMKTEVPQRAHTDIVNIQLSVDYENDMGQSDQQLMTRQMKIINYQLSSYKFIEDGWTVSPIVLSDFEMAAGKEISEDVITMDYTTSLYDLFGQKSIAGDFSFSGVARQYYPDGRLFLVLFNDGKGSIYYPSGNLAISIVRPSTESSVICIIKEDSPSIDSQAKVLAVINTNGFGSFSFRNECPRIIFNTILGVELNPDGTKRRQWFWNGEPHVHAPPFQPVCFSINRNIGVRISSQSSININFMGFTKQIHINVGCKVEIPTKIRNKMSNMLKIGNESIQRPLTDLKQRAKSYIEKCNEALDHPFLVSKNKWPIKPYILTRNSTENKTTLSLSMV